MMKKKKNIERRKPKLEFPMYCDYSCNHASFSGPTTIGACRKELAVWCKYFERYNNKNNRCFGTVTA
jgi:hypothetical protein